MAAVSTFDQWQKDVFFSAAEEVQESADTMESMYRMWIHERGDGLEPEILDDLRKGLHPTLGTAKWQLEEFERAVSLSHQNCSTEDNTITRHREFIDAIRNKILHVEKSIEASLLEEGKQPLQWVQLDEEERDDFEVFLSSASSSSPEKRKKKCVNHECSKGFKETVSISKDARYVVAVAAKDPFEDRDKVVMKEDRSYGRSEGESSSEIGAWKISIADEEDEEKKLPEATSKKLKQASNLRWFQRFGKAKSEEDIETREFSGNLALKGIARLAQGISGFSERSTSCFSSYREASRGYNIQQIGRAGGLQRHFQRSQSNKLSLRLTLLLVLTIFLIVPFLFISA